MNILEEALKLTTKDRNQDYGSAKDDFARANALYKIIKGGTDVTTPSDGLMYMMCVKLSRQAHKPKRDNIVDLCGYASLYQTEIEREGAQHDGPNHCGTKPGDSSNRPDMPTPPQNDTAEPKETGVTMDDEEDAKDALWREDVTRIKYADVSKYFERNKLSYYGEYAPDGGYRRYFYETISTLQKQQSVMCDHLNHAYVFVRTKDLAGACEMGATNED